MVTPETRVFCGGGATFYGRYFKCHKAGGHGSVAMREALEKSCNVYFYTLGNLLGVDRIHKWATALGLGEMSGVDLPHETRGIMPSTAWKKQRTGEKWYAGETISVAIGQGQVSVTPISLAVMMASVANGGTRIVPHIVRAIDNGKGWEQLPPPEGQKDLGLSREHVEVVREGLWRVVNGAGTGGRGRIVGYDVGGKTGTAQVISNQGKARARGDRDLRDHGWFVFFAPAQESDHCRRRVRRACRARLLCRADREVHDGDVVRQAGRAAPADAHAAARRARSATVPVPAAVVAEQHVAPPTPVTTPARTVPVSTAASRNGGTQ